MDPAERDITISVETEEKLRNALGGSGLDQITRERLIERAAPALARRRRRRIAWRTVGASAATLGLATVVTMLVLRSPAVPGFVEGAGIGPAADVNVDGVVDILDAHALARAVESGAGGPDLNSDGVSTRSDADWIADSVTRLEGASG